MNAPNKIVPTNPSVSKTDITELHRVLGASWIDETTVRFCVWSPTTKVVRLHVEGHPSQDMNRDDDGFHHVIVKDITAPPLYQFEFDNSGRRLPDPASRFQPDGVHGQSQLCRSSFDWKGDHLRGDLWKGVDRRDWVIYELHMGAFTSEGTYRSAIKLLDELVDLGITAIELMPIADAAGRWNWGYDGVNWFAPNRNYGSPDDLRAFVDAAHAKGLAVFLDVVYNHLGPEGNYLGDCGPYLSDRHHTVWGSAPNVDDPQHGDAVRRFIIANAIYWLDEFHFDGLRVDAIHCMEDDRDPHVVVEMAQAFESWSKRSNRPAVLIAESNVHDPEMTQPIKAGGCGFDAQWGDCFLHSVFAVLRPGEQLCQRTYQPKSDLDQVLRMGYVYRGTLRDTRVRDPLGPRVDTEALIYSIQNHDFIGNHPLGKRLHQATSKDAQRAAAAMLILTPAIPMLFMGEEFACENAFQFFVDFSGEELRQSVVDGRRREYPQHDWDAGVLPTDPAAFETSKIGPASEGDPEMRRWYQTLIRIRADWIDVGLLCDKNLTVKTDLDAGLFQLTYRNDSKIGEVIVRLNSDNNAGPIEHNILPDRNILANSRGPDDSPQSKMLQANHALVWAE